VFGYEISIFEVDVLLCVNIQCIIVSVENTIGECEFCYYFLHVMELKRSFCWSSYFYYYL